MLKYLNLRANIALGLLFAFLLNSCGPIPNAQAQAFVLPQPGTMVALSPAFNPLILKGLKVHPDNPFKFDFILSSPNALIGDPQQEQLKQLKQQSIQLIKYFLASLTTPEKDLWVNLSPYEKNRIVPDALGQTALGRDLLAEDYILKQITASLIYPEGETGKKFWKRIYAESAKKFGTTNIPVNTFNKVWILPDKAVVYENAKAGTAYVVEAKLKVMLEEDYRSTQIHQSQPGDMFKSELQGTCPQARCQAPQALNLKAPQGNHQTASPNVKAILREIVLPELTNEVNQGQNFAQLRQVYNSLILATWYKKKIKDSILAEVYANKNKVAGILSSPNASIGDPPHIYQQYLQAFKKGAYNYIKQEVDPITHQSVPRKYFSGGLQLIVPLHETTDEANVHWERKNSQYIESVRLDAAMMGASDIRRNAEAFDELFGTELDRLKYPPRIYNDRTFRNVIIGKQYEESEVLGTIGALSCSPIIIKGKRKLQIWHHALQRLDPAFKGDEVKDFFKEAWFFDLANSTIIMPYDVQYEPQYESIAAAVHGRYPKSKILLITSGKNLKKSSVAMAEGAAIIENSWGQQEPVKRFMSMTWEDIDRLFTSSHKNLVKIVFKEDAAMKSAVSDYPLILDIFSNIENLSVMEEKYKNAPRALELIKLIAAGSPPEYTSAEPLEAALAWQVAESIGSQEPGGGTEIFQDQMAAAIMHAVKALKTNPIQHRHREIFFGSLSGPCPLE